MSKGTVTAFDPRKGAGAITPDGGGPEIFVHISAIERAGISSLRVGDRVSFDVQTDQIRRKSFATNLILL